MRSQTKSGLNAVELNAVFCPQDLSTHLRFARLGVQFGLLDWKDIRRWGDEFILATASPSQWMLGLSFTRSEDVDYILAELSVCGHLPEGEPTCESTLYALVTLVAFRQSTGTLSADQALYAIAQLTWSCDASTPQWLTDLYGTLDYLAWQLDEKHIDVAEFSASMGFSISDKSESNLSLPGWSTD